MKKVLKGVVIVIAFLIGFIPAFLYFTGYFDENNTTEEELTPINMFTYNLDTPSVPLMNTSKLNYVQTRRITINDEIYGNYSFAFYIDSSSYLVIKDNKENKEVNAANMPAVKYVIDNVNSIFAVTNDGSLYYLTIDGNSLKSRNSLTMNEVNSFKKVKTSEKVSNFIRTLNANNKMCVFVETVSNKYYDLKYDGKEYTFDKEYSSSEEVIEKLQLNIYDSKYNYYIFSDGKVKYLKEQESGSVLLSVVDENGSQLYAYMMFPIYENDVYFLSLSNRLYNVAASDYDGGNTIGATKISSSKAKSLTYDKADKSKKITLKYEDGNSFEFNDVVISNSLNGI